MILLPQFLKCVPSYLAEFLWLLWLMGMPIHVEKSETLK
jgi:hypothetical protein